MTDVPTNTEPRGERARQYYVTLAFFVEHEDKNAPEWVQVDGVPISAYTAEDAVVQATLRAKQLERNQHPRKQFWRVESVGPLQ